MITDDFAWKMPLPDAWAAWHQEARSLVDAMSADQDRAAEHGSRLAELLYRLSNCRLPALEQLRLEKLAARLWPLRAHLAPFRPMRIGLIGNRTLDFMTGPLRAAGLARLLLVEPVMAPLDSAPAIAHGVVRPFGDAPLDAALLWQDTGSFHLPAILLDPEAERQALAAADENLRALARGLHERLGARIIIPTLAFDPRRRISSADLATPGSERRFTDGLNRIIADGAHENQWLIWDIAALSGEIGLQRWFDAQRFFEAKTPFALDLNPLVCDHLTRILAGLAGKARRALIMDLDNTVWGGVIGDDGLDGIEVGQGHATGEAFLAVQSMALELRQRGVVLCVCSKNSDETARQPFQQHPDMLLRENHIAVFQANWEDKATNIRAIADTLRLGLESIAFVDDNPAERARVRQELPFVAVPELDDQPAHYPYLLIGSGLFEHIPLTKDDLNRANAYQADAQRAQILATVGNYEEYLQSLRMTMQVMPFDRIGLPRIAQLISKSNQFNLTTRRYSAEALEKLAEDPQFLCWQVRLADAFSEHGMIAVIIVRKLQEDWIIDTWLQSCRVLERGVEQTLMNLLIARARAAGARRVHGQFCPTSRNGMVSDLYPRLGLSEQARPPAQASDGVWFTTEPDAYQPHFSAIAVTTGEP
jgi:FkbH-like protein